MRFNLAIVVASTVATSSISVEPVMATTEATAGAGYGVQRGGYGGALLWCELTDHDWVHPNCVPLFQEKSLIFPRSDVPFPRGGILLSSHTAKKSSATTLTPSQAAAPRMLYTTRPHTTAPFVIHNRRRARRNTAGERSPHDGAETRRKDRVWIQTRLLSAPHGFFGAS